MIRRAGALLAASVLLVLPACTSAPNGSSTDSQDRVLVFGIDGADWDRAIPLMRQGKLPALSRLARTGTSRTLISLPPGADGRERLSPTIWTSAATGRLPEAHGIYHFVTENESGGQQPVTSNRRQVASLWNMLTSRDRRVGVLGWLVTWPAEQVSGYVVSSYTPFIFRWGQGQASRPIKGTLVEGVPDQVWPPDLQAELERLKVAPGSITDRDLADRFTGVPLGTDPSEDLAGSIDGMRWSWAADATYEAAYHHLAENPPGGQRPELEMVYFASVDVISHRFWKYMEPDSWTDGPLGPDEIEGYGQSVESAYRSVDGVLARVLAREEAPVRTLILSDHGFRENRASTRATSSGWHRPQGMLLAEGPGIRSGRRLDPGSVVDVAPTVLYALGLPIGEDFDGEAALGLFTDEYQAAHALTTIPSWETEVAPLREGAPVTSPVDDEILERLGALGYLD